MMIEISLRNLYEVNCSEMVKPNYVYRGFLQLYLNYKSNKKYMFIILKLMQCYNVGPVPLNLGTDGFCVPSKAWKSPE